MNDWIVYWAIMQWRCGAVKLIWVVWECIDMKSKLCGISWWQWNKVKQPVGWMEWSLQLLPDLLPCSVCNMCNMCATCATCQPLSLPGVASFRAPIALPPFHPAVVGWCSLVSTLKWSLPPETPSQTAAPAKSAVGQLGFFPHQEKEGSTLNLHTSCSYVHL